MTGFTPLCVSGPILQNLKPVYPFVLAYVGNGTDQHPAGPRAVQPRKVDPSRVTLDRRGIFEAHEGPATGMQPTFMTITR